jgi:hypothetical protein
MLIEQYRIYQKHDADVPQYRKGTWKKVFYEEEASQLFHLPLQHRQFTNDFPVDGKEVIWQRIKSKSYVAVLDPQKQQKLQQDIYSLKLPMGTTSIHTSATYTGRRDARLPLR